jgi:hypothetical protein
MLRPVVFVDEAAEEIAPLDRLGGGWIAPAETHQRSRCRTDPFFGVIRPEQR